MNPGTLLLVRGDDLHSAPGEYRRVETSLHGEPSAQQSQSAQIPSLRFLGARFHDAHNRYRRASDQLVEHDVWGVGGHCGEVRSRCGEAIERRCQVFNHPLPSVLDDTETALDL